MTSAFYSRNQSYSRSANAEVAESEGRCPMSRAKKIVADKNGCSQATAAAALEMLYDGEWHHVGKFANCVAYYDATDFRLPGLISHITACGGAKKFAARREALKHKRHFGKPLPSHGHGFPNRFANILHSRREDQAQQAASAAAAAGALAMLTAEEVAMLAACDRNLRAAGLFSMGTAEHQAEYFASPSYTRDPSAEKIAALIRDQLASSLRWATND